MVVWCRGCSKVRRMRKSVREEEEEEAPYWRRGKNGLDRQAVVFFRDG